MATVRHVRGQGHRVYDLQVEGCRNFFAGQVLVHNCAIVDDVILDRQTANSPAERDRIWRWWSGTLLSRLAPGAPVFLIMTLWHPDDLAGRLLEREGRVEDGGRWKVVHLPAIADLDLTGGTDPLGRADGDPLPHPKVPDGDRAALLRHWEQKRSEVTAEDWASMYQGNPRVTERGLIRREWLEQARPKNPAALSYAQQLADQIAAAVDADPDAVGV